MGKKFNQYFVPEDGFIGNGAFGQVLKVFDSSLRTQRGDNVMRALKAMELDEGAGNELAVLIRLDHANLVKYYDHFEVNIRDNYQHVYLCVITEFCEVVNFKFFSCYLILFG